jgi:serine protease
MHAGTFSSKRLAVGLLLLAFSTSGLNSMPVQPGRGFLPEQGLAASGQIDPANLPRYGAQTQSGPLGDPTDQVIIKYKSTTDAFSAPAGAGQMARLDNASGISLQYLRRMSGNANVVRLPGRLPLAQVQAISAKLMTLPEVEYAEPDQILLPALTPNDTLYSNQWDLFEANGINAPAAWDVTTGVSSIVVADIDTGITNHADLSGRTVPGYDFIINTAVSNDGNGRDADPSDPGDWVAKNECFPGSSAENSSWHGTHTAGTIGAKSNNSLGVAGINWNSKILPVRVLGKCGGYDSDIIDGLRWSAGLAVSGVPANANPAKAANLSLGGSGACSTSWQNAVNDVNAAGMVVVVSAGNSSANASGYTPASCSGVITVAATDRSGSMAYYSNYGSTVEISAPGGAQSFANDPNGVLSTLNTGTTVPVSDTYIYYQGTSMAAPHVTGVVSLMFSINPSLTPAQVLQILQNTARPFPSGSTCTTSLCGSGMLDAGAAVNAVANPATATPTRTPTTTRTSTPTSSNTSTFTPSNTPTATRTSTPTSSNTPSFTPSNTPTATQTFTPTSSNTPSFTPSNISTATPTFTPTSSSTPTSTSTQTATPTFTPTSSASPTSTSTQTATPTFTPTSSMTLTSTPTLTPTTTPNGPGYLIYLPLVFNSSSSPNAIQPGPLPLKTDLTLSPTIPSWLAFFGFFGR